jgi:ADP-ribose pyrophosphatase YjhB (NUDIX family)
MTPNVACVVIPKKSRVLGITRREDHNDWGLPGGKLESGEDPKVGAARELLEETGIKVAPEDLYELFRAQDGEWSAITFAALVSDVEPKRQEGEGLVDWVTWDDLKRGSFGPYNRQLHDALRVSMPTGYMNGGWMRGRSVEDIDEIRAEAERSSRLLGDVAFDWDVGRILAHIPVKR